MDEKPLSGSARAVCCSSNGAAGRYLHMTVLFQKLIRGDLAAIIRAFGTLDAVPPKVAMIQEAAKVRFFQNPEHIEAVGNLMTQFSDLSHRRNEIAHGQVSKCMVDPDLTGYFLHPGIHSTGRFKKMFRPDFHPLGDYRYTAMQVKHYTDEFRRLECEIHLFMDALDASDQANSPQASQGTSS